MEVLEQVFRIFEADIDAHKIVRHASRCLLLRTGMEKDCRSRMDDERARIADVGDIERIVQVIDERERSFLRAEADRQHRAEAAAKLALGQFVIGIGGEAWVIDQDAPLFQILSQRQRRRGDAVEAQCQRVEPDARQVGVHRRLAAAVIRDHAHAQPHEKARRSEAIFFE